LLTERLRSAQAVLGEADAETHCALHDLGTLWLDLGRLRDAEPLLRRALRLRRALAAGRAEAGVVATTGALARLQRREGRWEEAEALCRAALAGAAALYGDEHAETVAHRALLGALAEDARAAAAEAARSRSAEQWARRLSARRAGAPEEGDSSGQGM